MEQFSDGEFPFAAQFQSVIRDLFDDDTFVKGGVTNELVVTINMGTLGQADTLQVATGEAEVQGTTVTKGAATNVQIDAEGTLNQRYDLVTIASTGTVNVTKGTTNRVAPDIPSGECVLAVVGVPNGNTSIGSVNIHDARAIGNFPNRLITALANFGVSDQFTGYPLGPPDVDTDVVEGNPIWSEGFAPGFGG